jgi:guanylate kinase
MQKMPKMKGKLIVISAPSGSGKSSLINAVRSELGEKALAYSVSHTTRKPRPGEIEGKDYYFVSQDEFSKMVKRGEFLEYAHTFGNSYGTSRTQVNEHILKGQNVVADVDVVGAANIKKIFKEAVTIFIAPPSFEVLKERLLARNTETPESIVNRLQRVKEEVSYRKLFDFLVINDTFKVAKEELISIIQTGKGPPMKDDEFWEDFFK